MMINYYINYDIHACKWESMYGLILNTVEQSRAKKGDRGGETEGGLMDDGTMGKKKKRLLHWTTMSTGLLQPSVGATLSDAPVHLSVRPRPLIFLKQQSHAVETSNLVET